MVSVVPYSLSQIVVMVLLTYYFLVMLVWGLIGTGVVKNKFDVKYIVLSVWILVGYCIVQFVDVRLGTVMFFNGMLLVANVNVYGEMGKEVIAQW